MGRVNDDIITLLNNYYFRSDRINFLGVSVIRRSDCIIIEILFTAQSQDCANMLSAGNNRDLNRGGDWATHGVCLHCRLKSVYYRATFDICAEFTVI